MIERKFLFRNVEEAMAWVDGVYYGRAYSHHQIEKDLKRLKEVELSDGHVIIDETAPVHFKPGDKVTYTADYSSGEHGVVKSVRSYDYCFVVYNCAGNWDRIDDYTAAKTNIRDLKPGWLPTRCPRCCHFDCECDEIKKEE